MNSQPDSRGLQALHERRFACFLIRRMHFPSSEAAHRTLQEVSKAPGGDPEVYVAILETLIEAGAQLPGPARAR